MDKKQSGRVRTTREGVFPSTSGDVRPSGSPSSFQPVTPASDLPAEGHVLDAVVADGTRSLLRRWPSDRRGRSLGVASVIGRRHRRLVIDDGSKLWF